MTEGIREDLPKKRMFTFRHCPNQGGGRPLPEFFGPFFTVQQALILINFYSKVIIFVCFLVIVVINFINIITITIIIIMSTIIIIICTFFLSYAQYVVFDVRKKRTKLPELGSWGGGLGNSGNARKKTFFFQLISSLIVLFFINVDPEKLCGPIFNLGEHCPKLGH